MPVQAQPLSVDGLLRGGLRWRPNGLGRGNSLDVLAMAHNTTPEARGLYDPANDSDACGTLTCDILCQWTLGLLAGR